MDKMKKQLAVSKQPELVISSSLESDNSAAAASLQKLLEGYQTTMGTQETSFEHMRSELEAFKRGQNAAQETSLTTIFSEVENQKSTTNTLVVQLENQIQVLQADKTQVPTTAHVNECLQKVQTGVGESAIVRQYVKYRE